jgi:alkanesulfonate monooxygenase SsuD/methylene tetrahydromethanopterin reductase-like flavin-dependent oxidoreductase (luciferase family)
MKIGVSLNMLAESGVSDATVVNKHLELGTLAEPLGFDSIFALEHHFTGYAMSPSPTQLLSYFAGRTSRILLGTAVIVLPWHDPIRVAEEIALLDVLCGGRCLFGFGRGVASAEYAGFRIPMEEARPRFLEAAQVILKALTNDTFSWDGHFFKIPPTSIRPRPMSHPERRFYASSVSPESAEMMAKLGFAMCMIMQNEWSKAAEDIEKFNSMASNLGFPIRPPLILTSVSCASSRQEAKERGHEYLSNKWDAIDNHYRFSDNHLATQKGYESYASLTKTYGKLKDPAYRKKALDFYTSIQIVGTPDDCLEQLAELRKITGTDHVITDFCFGGMSHEAGEMNMRLFAQDVLSVVHRDPAFSSPRQTAAQHAPIKGDSMFVPA